MKRPFISIIIPVYNVEKYLNRCIESITKQTLTNIEIILVNDGSLDNCPQICEEWSKKDNRIKVIHKNNEGLGLARNTGMLLATGEFIAFVDSDDYVELNMYEKLYATSITYNADIVYCGYKQGLPNGSYIDKSDYYKKTIFDNKIEIENLSIKYFYPLDGRIMMMSVWHSIYKREVIKTEFYSERDVVSEDLHFQLSAILNSKKIVYIPDNLYFYCYNENSLSHTFNIKKFYGYQKLLKLLLGLYPNKKQLVYIFYYNFSLNLKRQILSNKNLSSKEKKRYLKEIYSNSIWKEIKQGTTRSIYSKHHKLFYDLMGKNIFSIYYLLSLFDYYVICKKLFLF